MCPGVAQPARIVIALAGAWDRSVAPSQPREGDHAAMRPGSTRLGLRNPSRIGSTGSVADLLYQNGPADLVDPVLAAMIAAGYEPGVVFGKVLAEVRELQHEGVLADREQALALAGERVAALS